MITLIHDTETTGIPKHMAAKDKVQPRVIEWAGILVDAEGNELGELELLINPEIPLEEIITKITGLTDEDLANEPTFPWIADELLDFYKEADCLLAHNLPFDYTMVEMELQRHNLEWHWPQHMICTVQELVPEFGYRPKLTQAYEHFTGNKYKQTHRGMDDVRALKEVAVAAGVLF